MAASEVYIEGTDTDPEVMARTVVREIHQRLRTGLAELTDAESTPDSGDRLSARLVDFCLRDLRQYLVAADRILYTPASGRAETRLLVDALRVGASALSGRIDTLVAAGSVDAGRIGVMIGATLDLHLQVEELVLLPALAELPGLDLSLLVSDLPAYPAGDRAQAPAIIDVRQIARGGRHPRVFARYARLLPGEAFILIHSQDPKPLRREFEAIHPEAFTWDYLRTGPEEWRVRIGRVAVDA